MKSVMKSNVPPTIDLVMQDLATCVPLCLAGMRYTVIIDKATPTCIVYS